MAKVKRIHHVAVVVPEIEGALAFWRDALGIEVKQVEDVPSQKSSVAFLPLGDSEIELVQPTQEGSGVAKFLAERGPGMHHVCLEVDNIDEMLDELKHKQVRLINETPLELEGRKMAFVHPKSANGVLVELYEITSL
ncbi:MAG: methylmalonyl-CoA epimerase [Chloroflexi bacterium]|jgi:methylmalonyl-CoA/ethylmalonyl-CoA epimerase|nr:methylmalonyl-CoA epimerase [Anaerolineaceae bacterium]NMB88501.1 methylmalonyl-CoA epimerase [Chloroflexota bacterium]